MCQSALQGTLPAFPAVVQVGSSPGKLAGRIHLHSLGSAHETEHLRLGKTSRQPTQVRWGTCFTRWTGFLDTFISRHCPACLT